MVDDDFGPFFLKFCSYFPYNAKLCINGHEYLKRQLAKRGIGSEPLDNGILRCADPAAMQRLADGLTAAKIDALLRKWLVRLPHPFSAHDREQGIGYDISILQAEFARTEVFDRPVAGRVFFEEVLRENLDMGRPDHVQLVFNRRVSRRTRTRHRSRVITDGVIPSLHVDYKRSRIKQYHKEGRALRTETVINDTYDFDVGRRLRNLDDLKRIGFAANRRLLGVERLSHDATIGAETLAALHRPAHIDGQRASTLRFGDPRVQALLAALLRFDLLPAGFRNWLRDHEHRTAGRQADPKLDSTVKMVLVQGGGVAGCHVGAGRDRADDLDGAERGAAGGPPAAEARKGCTRSDRVLLRSRAMRVCVAAAARAGPGPLRRDRAGAGAAQAG